MPPSFSPASPLAEEAPGDDVTQILDHHIRALCAVDDRDPERANAAKREILQKFATETLATGDAEADDHCLDAQLKGAKKADKKETKPVKKTPATDSPKPPPPPIKPKPNMNK